MATREKQIIDYFDNIGSHFILDGAPIMEVKLPDEVLDEWLEWSKKYKKWKTHNLSFLKDHINKGENTFQISISTNDLENSITLPFTIRLGEYFMHRLHGLSMVRLRKCITVRTHLGHHDNSDYWLNYTNMGDSNPIHVHAGNLSSVIYIDNVEDTPTYFVLKDGREIRYEPQVGYVLIFPSNQEHYVKEKETDKERVTASFNLNFNNTRYDDSNGDMSITHEEVIVKQ